MLVVFNVKPNGNVNVVITDVNVTIQATSQDGILLTPAQVEQSHDLRRLETLGLLIITNLDDEVATPVTPTVPTAPVVEATEPVETHAAPEPQPPGTFVAHPENLVGNVLDVFIKTNPEPLFADKNARLAFTGTEEAPTIDFVDGASRAPAETAAPEVVTPEAPAPAAKKSAPARSRAPKAGSDQN